MQCLQPKYIPNIKTGKIMPVGCGKCLSCQKFRAGSWTMRMMQELKNSRNNWFITLTLNEDHLVYGADTSASLNKRDLQLYHKKLRKGRKNTEGVKFSYYSVGEYGETYGRPHYHEILFNTGIKDKSEIHFAVSTAWSDNKGLPMGFIHVGEVTEASIRYVAGYLEKGIYGETPNENIQRTFSMMSKGIGQSFLEKNKKWYETNKKFEYSVGGGKFLPLPRYYKEKLFSEEERSLHAESISAEYESLSQRQRDIKKEAARCRAEALKRLKPKRQKQ